MKEYVDEVFKCPKCGEREVDKLEHDGNKSEHTGYDHIKCLSCEHEYVV